MSISVIDPFNGRNRLEVRSNADFLPNTVSFGADDNTLLVAGERRKTFGSYAVIEHSIRERRHLRSFATGHIENVVAIMYRQDLDILATAGADKTVELRRYSTGALLRTVGDKTNQVYSIAAQAEGNQFVSAGGVINIWPLTAQ
jgi:WD40 repeat protein